MKAKKAVKKLDKVVAILSDTLKQYAPSDRHVRELLDAAKASVVRAKAAVVASSSPKTEAKARVKVKKTEQKRAAAVAKKKLPAPVKRPRAVAKRKSVPAGKKAAVTSKKRLTVAKSKAAEKRPAASLRTAALDAKPPAPGDVVEGLSERGSGLH